MTDKPTLHIIEGADVHARADAVILAAHAAIWASRSARTLTKSSGRRLKSSLMRRWGNDAGRA
jgi:ribosomal protein L35AE/L33A